MAGLTQEQHIYRADDAMDAMQIQFGDAVDELVENQRNNPQGR